MRAPLDRGQGVQDSPRLTDSRSVPGPDVPSFMTRRDGQVIPGRVAQKTAAPPQPARAAAPVAITRAASIRAPTAVMGMSNSTIFLVVFVLLLAGGVGYAIYHSHHHKHYPITQTATLDSDGVHNSLSALAAQAQSRA